MTNKIKWRMWLGIFIAKLIKIDFNKQKMPFKIKEVHSNNKEEQLKSILIHTLNSIEIHSK